eukprot:CAMPEP_0115242370 /NCGR_PEP_ID=MMETSP0270-20121206/38916_1 /TAXON_ID=71861 /ORGANISM="Scrippsiella trochoidea, Strain CCMP3099" /LENGTH=157 /DNA_ID=CAMNT_0002657431 /DNA_START=28 /DNA_END=499 /DNA_ORIENTATION=+
MASHRSASTVLPLATIAGVAVLLLLCTGSAFVPAPAVATEAAAANNLRFLQAAAVSSGSAVLASGALPALAEEIDSAEAYNRKVMTGAAYCLTLAFFLMGLIVSQARKLVENGGSIERWEVRGWLSPCGASHFARVGIWQGFFEELDAQRRVPSVGK